MNLFKCIPYESKVKTGAIIAAVSAIYSIYVTKKEIAEAEFVEVPAPLLSDFKKLSKKKKKKNKDKDKDKDKDKKKKKKDKDKDKKKKNKDKENKKKKVYKYDPADDDINLVYQDEDEDYEEDKQVKRKKSKSSKESESFDDLVSNIHDIIKSKDNDIMKYNEDEDEDDDDEDYEEDIDEDENGEDEDEEDIHAANARNLLENILQDMDNVEKRISDKYEGTDDYDDIYFVFAGLYKEIYNTINLFITEIKTVNMTDLHETYSKLENLFTWYCKFVASYIPDGDPHKYLDRAIRTLRGLKDIDIAMEKYSPVSDEISYDDIAELFSPEVVDSDTDDEDEDDDDEEVVDMLPKSIAENIKGN